VRKNNLKAISFCVMLIVPAVICIPAVVQGPNPAAQEPLVLTDKQGEYLWLGWSQYKPPFLVITMSLFFMASLKFRDVFLEQKNGRRNFDDALAEFSVAYADQNERDHAALMKAIRSGRIEARTTE
jgi:hypothetical protein